MKKNLVLYILLFFLITVNGFFLYNYLGDHSVSKQHSQDLQRNRKPKGPGNLIVKQLKFNASQTQQFEDHNEDSHENIREISEETNRLKEALFSKASEPDKDLLAKDVDSISNLIGKLEQKKERLTFYNLKTIFDICDHKQKEAFKKIMNDAMDRETNKHNGPDRRQGPPPRHH